MPAASEGRGPRCHRHRTAPAGWGCSGCGAELCPDCVARKPLAHGAEYDVCVACGRQAFVLRAHRAEQRSYAERLVDVWRFPLSRSGLAAIAVTALVLAVLSYARVGIVARIALGIFWSYFFFLVRSSANGATTIDVPDFTDSWEDLFKPALKGLLAMALVWGPTLAYVLFVQQIEAEPELSLLRALDPAAWVLFLACVVHAPMAFLTAGLDGGFVDMLHVPRNVRAMVALGRDYWIALGALVGLFVADQLVELTLGRALWALPIPFVSRWLSTAVGLYGPFVLARALGLLIYVRGDVIGWGRPEQYLDRWLPGAEPRARLEDVAAPPPQPPPQVGPDLDLLREPARPVAVAPGARTVVALPPPPLGVLREALERGDAAAAADGLRALSARDFATLTPPELHALATLLHAAGELRLAVRALKAIVTQDGEISLDAHLALADLYRELGDLDSTERLWRDVLRRFPDSEAARLATGRLAELGYG